MERALGAFELRGPWGARRAAWRLRETGPCVMCEMNLQRVSGGFAPEALVRAGREPRELCALAMQTKELWWPTVCGRCLGTPARARCRPHFREGAMAGPVVEVAEHRALVQHIVKHMAAYSRSFRWEDRDTETDADRAALISAVGWCSGWHGLMAMVLNGGHGTEAASG